MKILARYLLTLVGVCFVVFLLMYGALNITVLNSVRSMEKSSSTNVMQGMQTALDAQSKVFMRANKDWSSWDETYLFAGGENPMYAETELSNVTILNLELSLCMMLDKEGKASYYTGTGTEEWKAVAVRQITSTGSFIANDPQWSMTGFATIADKSALVVANPILNSNDTGPVIGTLVWVKQLDSDSFQDLTFDTGVKITATKLSYETEQYSKSIQINEVNSTVMQGTLFVSPSIEGLDGIQILATFTRSYYAEALASIYILSFFAVLVGFAAIVVFQASVMALLKRFEDLGARVAKLDPGKSLNHLVYKEHDELSKFVDSINMLIDEIEENKSKLAEKERLASMGQTASMVGHDLRNPLQVVTLTNFMLRRNLEKCNIPDSEDRKITGFLNTLDEQVRYMDKIVGDIQTFAKDPKPILVCTDIIDLAKDTISTITLPKNVEVGIEVNPNLPKVNADPQLMRRVYQNLMLNAAQAMPKGGTLRVYGDVTKKGVTISIEDTGCGITPEIMEKLFTPFQTTKAKGTGLGLVSVKKIIEAHHGTIKVDSKVGQGTRFYFTLPAADRPTLGKNEKDPEKPLESDEVDQPQSVEKYRVGRGSKPDGFSHL